MEELHCDGCDFRAESYDELKAHIQEVHTAFLQPTDVGDHGRSTPSNSESLNSPSQTKGRDGEEEDVLEEDDDDDEEEETVDTDSKPSETEKDTGHQTKPLSTADSSIPFFQCKFCVRYFRSMSFLTAHTRKVHGAPAGDKLSHSSDNESCYKIITHDDLTKVYSCQYCTYKSPRKARILKHQRLHHKEGTPKSPQGLDESCTDPAKKQHENLKIPSALTLKGEGSVGSTKSDSPSSPGSSPNSDIAANDGSGHEVCSESRGASGSSARKTLAKMFQYPRIPVVAPNSTESSTLSERSTFVSDVSRSAVDIDSGLLNNEDSGSSSGDEDVEDDLNDADASVDDSVKQLLSEEDNKMLETKGVPFRRYMNRFQCPFCSFLTMHRRSISRHIENIHLSGKTTVYKCDECPFICTSPLKLGTHKQSHTPDWDTMDLTSESPDPQNDGSESVNGGTTKVNGKKLSDGNQQHPHRCTLCSFSTATLKGLRVHQQHKHSYCDDVDMQLASGLEGSTDEQTDVELDTSSIFVQKTQTSILGLSSKKGLTGKTARKSINDLPLDLSPVKKRTRIDEIANNLQSKISQSQLDMVINLEDMEDDEERAGENHMDADKDDNDHKGKNNIYYANAQSLFTSQSSNSRVIGRAGKRKSHPRSKVRNIAVALSDEENESADPKDLQDQSSFQEYTEETGVARFYCKHCDYHNKSARSVSTHYQRMHPYIKFSFRYILDPEDQSAVFRCLECYIEYTNYNDLHQHYMDHHPEASNVLNFNQPDLVYMCRFCSYTSPNVRSLMPHYQRMHPTVKINNAMIFSSYVVEQPHKSSESQTLREILNSGPKSLSSSSSTPRSSGSPALKSISKAPQETPSSEVELLKEALGGNVVVYDCDICQFASPNMHSVLVHYQKKHPEQKASYFRIQKAMRVLSVERPQPAANSNYNDGLATPQKSLASSPFGSDDEVYYCKHCVYSNRSVVGVLVHYQKRHPEIKVTAKYIKHAPPTPGLMKLMDELQIAAPKQFLKQFNNNGHEGSGNSRLGGEKGEAEMLFFCQHCDYGNRTVKGVLIHYQKKHRDTKANADLVRRHTAVVRSQRERAQMVQSGTSPAVTPADVDPENSANVRSLKCKHCSYSSPYVYALKKHLKKDHPTVKATAMTILHWAYQEGILEAGYHCEWCIYSHAEPNGLLLHYQRRHPEHNVDYTYMASKLWAGPDTSTAPPANQQTKHYRCRDCAFEACSVWEITNHYQAVHPWVLKGDETIILDIVKANGAPEKPQQHPTTKRPATTFVYQTLQEDGVLDISTTPQDLHQQPERPHPRLSLSSISSNPYQCTVCLSEYNSLHGLLTHYGKKHPGMKVKAADFAQEADINPSSVYKCRHCPYVNSRIHGVLTHYQKRHPLVKVTAEDFADDIEHIKDLCDGGDDKCKTQRQGYGAYRCKMCPYTHGTLEKLKIHYEKYHNQPASDMFTPSLMHISASKDDPVAECSATSAPVSAEPEVQEVSDFDRALSQFPINKTEKHSIFRCQLCKYFCSTRKGIARHYRIKHNNVRAQPEGKNNVFKCALCAYTNPIRKGLAAHYQKRHDIDAYYTHCLAASKTVGEKPTKVVLPMPGEGDGAELSDDLRMAVESRKCSLCGFQAFSRKSIVSHYIKRHPGVFPKKQHSSKLGRYFTVLYAKEPDSISTAQEEDDKKGVVELEPEPKPEPEPVPMDAEWQPFKCLKCFRQSFGVTETLCDHYNSQHEKDLRRDFVIQGGPEEDGGAELYQCAHCELKFLRLLDLGKHLVNHNDEFQKRAMRQERRRQLLSKQKTMEPAESKAEKESNVNKTPIGFRCNFCVEVHPTLRAICNHLRKHVQYGEAKEGHVKQEVSEVPLSLPQEKLTNGETERVVPMGLEAEGSMGMEGVIPDEFGGATPISTPTISMPGALAAVAAVAETPAGRGNERLLVGGHPCAQCDRVFMSMQGLRSHERSHSAMALFTREDKYSCQYCQFASPFRHNLDRHVQSHHAHHKPFRCKLCPFKSAYLSRLKSHLHKAHAGENTYKCLSCSFSSSTIIGLKDHSLRDHGEPLTLTKIRAATQAAVHSFQRAARLDADGEQDHLPNGPDDPAYMEEPADVRQQLTHYQLASRSQVTGGPEGRHDNGVLTCEFCEFSSGYMQSLRRHYRDRHGGKKLFKCKDCSYFTCYKSTFTLHVKAGHASVVVEEGPKDLRCPLCLYHTKHKSNMIDHIVLHREERTAPLEVSRSKLSRHLQGLVFRCHKCTFTCSSDHTLQLHLRKHDELKPYQCQLCYYDCPHRHQLEEHLRSEHKVIRNFELMGRVNLDKLEIMKERGSSAEEEEEREEEEEEGGAVCRELEAIEHEAEATEEEMEDDPVEEEEQAEEEEQEEEEKEVVKTSPQESSACPSSSGLLASREKKLPCEFCGRCFTDSLEWERHVLRHGMTVNNSVVNPSSTSAIEASAPPPLVSTDMTDSAVDLSSNSMEANPSQSHNLNEEDKEATETKNDQYE